MSYLRIRNFWDYQNADAWTKARQNKGGHRHPAWCKLYVARDLELDAEKPIVRLVFYELLRLATVCGNVIPNDISRIANAISTPRQDVAQAIPRLLKGGWLLESATARRSREPSRKVRTQKQIEIREEKIVESSTSNGYTLPLYDLRKLLSVLPDKDSGTEHVIRGIAHSLRLPQAAFGQAIEAAQSDSALSPTKVAIAVLKAYERTPA